MQKCFWVSSTLYFLHMCIVPLAEDVFLHAHCLHVVFLIVSETKPWVSSNFQMLRQVRAKFSVERCECGLRGKRPGTWRLLFMLQHGHTAVVVRRSAYSHMQWKNIAAHISRINMWFHAHVNADDQGTHTHFAPKLRNVKPEWEHWATLPRSYCLFVASISRHACWASGGILGTSMHNFWATSQLVALPKYFPTLLVRCLRRTQAYTQTWWPGISISSSIPGVS